jgi:hypothetical protein
MVRVARRYAVLAALVTSPLPAQVVRGRVTEVNVSTTVPGALVSLLRETGDSTVFCVLTAAAGDYAIRAPAPGRYRISVKRIGVRRFVSEPFDLADGETRGFDAAIDPVALTLPQVTVSGLCATRPRELARIASLWEEARTALEATQISLRDRLMEAQIARYAAELEPGRLRVMFDWRSDAQVMSEQPFHSLSGDSLSEIGYWRQLPGDSVEYQGPDASALASNAFLRDHCFSLAPPIRNRPDLTGIAFVPARDRRLPDIAGTIWLDARRFELRSVEVRSTRLPSMPNAEQVGGEAHYTRLGTGAWIVDRWFIRMPQVIVRSDDWPRRQLREEGGAVITDSTPRSAQMASVRGVFRDSAGRPEAGAVVRAIGTHQQVVTATDGSYRFDNLPPGGLSLVVHTDAYDAMALLAGERRLTLQPGRSVTVDFRAPNATALRREACPSGAVTAFSRRPRPARGVLRLLMVDSATSVPLPGVRFIVSWPAIRENASADSTVEAYRQAVTDSRGAATFCDLPPGFPLEVSVLAPGTRIHVMMAEVSRNEIVSRVVFGRLTR